MLDNFWRSCASSPLTFLQSFTHPTSDSTSWAFIEIVHRCQMKMDEPLSRTTGVAFSGMMKNSRYTNFTMTDWFLIKWLLKLSPCLFTKHCGISANQSTSTWWTPPIRLYFQERFLVDSFQKRLNSGYMYKSRSPLPTCSIEQEQPLLLVIKDKVYDSGLGRVLSGQEVLLKSLASMLSSWKWTGPIYTKRQNGSLFCQRQCTQWHTNPPHAADQWWQVCIGTVSPAMWPANVKL